jgi:dynein heavy chain
LFIKIFILILSGIQQIALTVKSQIEDFKPSIPLIQALRAPGMRNRHWEEVCLIDFCS